MSTVFGMSEEEKKKILEQHKDATKNYYLKKKINDEGLKKPEPKTEDKKTT